jgi:hypothetical protein
MYPDYPNDLSAMHEVLKLCINTDCLRRDYHNELYFIVLRDDLLNLQNRHARTFAVENPEARQQSEAFLKTFNLWKE